MATLLGIARTLVLKVKRGRRLTRLALSSVVASTAERLDTFLLTVKSQPVTRRVTTVARRVTLPRTVPTRGPMSKVSLYAGTAESFTSDDAAFASIPQKHMLERCHVADNIQSC